MTKPLSNNPPSPASKTRCFPAPSSTEARQDVVSATSSNPRPSALSGDPPHVAIHPTLCPDSAMSHGAVKRSADDFGYSEGHKLARSLKFDLGGRDKQDGTLVRARRKKRGARERAAAVADDTDDHRLEGKGWKTRIKKLIAPGAQAA